MKKSLLTISPILLLLFSSVSMAVGPGAGTKSKYNVRIGQCNADSITVKWKLDSLMSEPVVGGSFKWTGNSCSLPSSTTIWLKVADNYGGAGYVKLSPATPKANAGYGYNTSGSPSWNNTVCGYRGTSARGCLSKKDAVSLWKNGRVVDFVVQW